MAIIDKWADKTAAPNARGRRPMVPKEQRKGMRWRADWTGADGSRKRKDFPTEDEAKTYHARMVQQIRNGSYVDPKLSEKETVASLNVEFVKRMTERGLRAGKGPASPKTLDNYRRQYENYIGPRWGHTPLANVTYEATADWIATLEGRANGEPSGKPAGESTKRTIAAAFGRLMNHAVRLKYLPANPAKDPVGGTDYMPAKSKKRKHVYLSMEQLMTLASCSVGYEDLILVAGLGGLRWGEVSALQVQDVTLGKQPHLTVCRAFSDLPKDSGGLVEKSTKNDEERVVPLPRWLADLLAVRVEGKTPESRVFSSERGFVLRNSLFTRRQYGPAIEAAALLMGGEFPRPTFHDLRHTAVSLAIKSGANVKVVQQIAGHSSATLTLDTYAGLFTDDLHDSAARLDAAMTATLAGSPSLSRHWSGLLPNADIENNNHS